TADEAAAHDVLADTSDSFEPLDESDDPFDGAPKTAASEGRRFAFDNEPRRVSNPADATPIRKASRSASAAVAKSGRPRLASDDELELREDLDAAAREQSEQALDEDEVSGPSLAAPSRPAGKRGSTGRPLLMEEPPKKQPGFPARGAPVAQARDDAKDGDPSDEAIEGYTIVERKQTSGKRGPSGSPAISIVDARDDDNEDLEELGGFVPKEANSRR